MLYKEVTGESWPPKEGIYADMYDGSYESNMEIKNLLIDEANSKYIYNITDTRKVKDLPKTSSVGILKTENIDNPIGLDYSSPEFVPVYQKDKNYVNRSLSSLQSTFTYDNMQSFSDTFKCRKGCAETITMALMDDEKYSLIDRYNYRGDAWTFLKNAESKGVPTINIYKDLNSEDFTTQDTIRYAYKATKDPKFQQEIMDNLSAGNVVTIMNPNSDMFETAKKESNGHSLSTHMGVVVDVGGKKYIAHSVNKNRKLTPVEDLLKGSNMTITGMALYNKFEEQQEQEKHNPESITADLSQYGFDLQTKELTRTDRISSISAYRAERSLHNNAEVLQSELHVSDKALKLTADILPALMYRETNSGVLDSEKYRRSSQYPILDIGKFAVHQIKGRIKYGTPVSESIGLTNVKLQDENHYFSKDTLKLLGLDKHLTREQKESPELTAILTAVSIDKRMRELDMLLGDTKSEVPEDVYNALIVMNWSQSLDNMKININRFKKTGDLNELSQYTEFESYKKFQLYMSYLGKKFGN